ncbi:carboxymuconolactone decarboxylase family protein [Mycetocola spongiae]|uniref:carboxymuconolactone decarboxylase family protein n=1 Tax=Mycetocola spongiae TaxID=2859226 RepID=UPI001CF561F0|nr:carboxymuconolactone decarboxylase family protein [Mycetocola spongiae]UCR89364.1 carboxymuconolactone decarboxylase family protein [Mycetocola spongiae]
MTRLNIAQHSPAGYRAVAALDALLRDVLDPELLDLVKLRASQLNGCAFCVDMHGADLGALGVPVRKIIAVSAWREAGFFSPRERAALALTEEVTLLPGGVSAAVWAEAAGLYSEPELANLVLAIGTINLWNRIGVSTELTPPPLAG